MRKYFYSIGLCAIIFFILEFVLLIIINYDYENKIKTLHQSLTNTMLGQIQLKNSYVSETFIPLILDVQYLVSQRSTQVFLADTNKVSSIKEDLKRFTKSNPNYQQVRVLDTEGHEMIRVNQTDSTVEIVSKENLQNKSHREYFKKTIALNENEIYISKLDLNMENGKIEIPFNPMIRVGMPLVYNQKKIGALIINYKATTFLDNIANTKSFDEAAFFLLNKQGSILSGPKLYEKFSFESATNNLSFTSYFPNVWDKITTEEEGAVMSEKGFFAYSTMFPYRFSSKINKKFNGKVLQDEHSWIMVSYINQNLLDDSLRPIKRDSIKYVILSIIIGFVVAFALTYFRRKEVIYLKRLRDFKDSLETSVLIRTQELVLAKRKLQLNINDLKSSIRYAKKVQETILPESQLVKKYFLESFIFYRPKDIVAGDFYWMHTFTSVDSTSEKPHVLFAVADCTGHGVPGAMVSLVCFNALNKAVKEEGITIPSKILDRVAELVDEAFNKGDRHLNDGMDISICCLNTKTNVLQWAGANHPLWIVKSSKIIEVKPNRQPIGCCDFRVKTPFLLHELQLEKNDVIYLFTDGFIDQFNGKTNRKLMKSGMRKLILEINKLESMEEQREKMISFFDSWRASTMQIDDVCVVGLKI